MYDPDTITALERGELVLRDFWTAHGKSRGGAPVSFHYWTGEDNVAANVVPPGAISPVSRNYVGGGTLLEVPPIIDAIGQEARSVTFGFDHTSNVAGSPMDMVFGHNIRVARVELHRGVFDPQTWHFVSEPHLLFAGRVDGAEVDDAAVAGTGSLTIDAVSSAIELSKINPALESDEQQKLRSEDRFRRWGDAEDQLETWWGQAKS